MSERRVVITGMGLVTGLGETVDGFWDRLVAGENGVKNIARFDVSRFDVRFGGECLDFCPNDHFERKESKRLDRFAQFALVAAKSAAKQSGIDFDREDPTRVGVVLGSGMGGLTEFEEQFTRLHEKGPSRVSAFTIPKLMLNGACASVAIKFNAQGESAAVATACASAAHAMGYAWKAIKANHADILFTGGTEAALTPLGLAAFTSMKALSTRNDDPARASRPFDKDRDGFVLAEGAGLLIFEELERARRRGAEILAEVVGFGDTSDTSHLTQPQEDGAGASRAMRLALQTAGINPDQVDYVNAHGTATILGDIAEVRAIKRTFGSHAYKLCVSSTKSQIGHLLGASGGVEAIVCILSIRNGVVTPTINLENVEPEIDLDFVPNTSKDRKVRYVISNSFGFGGHNACVVFARFS